MCNPLAIAAVFVSSSVLNTMKQHTLAEANAKNVAEFDKYQQAVLDLKKEQTEAQARYEMFQKVRETVRELSRNRLANVEANTYGNIFGRTEYDVRMQSDLDKATIQTNLENNLDQINREKVGVAMENINQISQLKESVPTGLFALLNFGTAGIQGYALGKSLTSTGVNNNNTTTSSTEMSSRVSSAGRR